MSAQTIRQLGAVMHHGIRLIVAVADLDRGPVGVNVAGQSGCAHGTTQREPRQSLLIVVPWPLGRHGDHHAVDALVAARWLLFCPGAVALPAHPGGRLVG